MVFWKRNRGDSILLDDEFDDDKDMLVYHQESETENVVILEDGDDEDGCRLEQQEGAVINSKGKPDKKSKPLLDEVILKAAANC